MEISIQNTRPMMMVRLMKKAKMERRRRSENE